MEAPCTNLSASSPIYSYLSISRLFCDCGEMVDKKVYYVHKGHEPGTYLKWKDCQAQVDGYPGNCYESNRNTHKYAVFEGRKPGVYKSWEKAHAQVNGYSGAKYESFDSVRAAKKSFSNYNKQNNGGFSKQKGYY